MKIVLIVVLLVVVGFLLAQNYELKEQVADLEANQVRLEKEAMGQKLVRTHSPAPAPTPTRFVHSVPTALPTGRQIIAQPRPTWRLTPRKLGTPTPDPEYEYPEQY